jgi:DNA-directed RNA polymerase subunit beta
MNKLFVNNIGDLTEAQRASFYRFLSLGLSEELEHFTNPFIANIKGEGRKKVKRLIYLYPDEIKLKGPNFPMNACLKQNLSYSIQLYIKAEYSTILKTTVKNELENEQNINKTKKETNGNLVTLNNLERQTKKVRIKKDLFFGEIPLMTEDGTFILNGCERVIISQIIRSPGIYFRKEYGLTRTTIYTATIISNKGLWTKIVLDQQKKTKEKTSKLSKQILQDTEKKETVKDRIYLFGNGMKGEKENAKKESDIDKIYIYDLLRYFRLNFQEISDTLKYPLHLKNFKYTKTQEEDDFKSPDIFETAEQTKQFIFNSRSSSFSIGEIGRYKINKKLGLNLPKELTYLTAHDFIKIIDGLIELKYYNRPSDDIDDIKNKQIRCLGDLLQNQIRDSFIRLKILVK